MDVRHEWWVRDLRKCAESRQGFVPQCNPAAAQAALDWIAEQEENVGDVDSLCDAIAREGRVLKIEDVEDLLAESGEGLYELETVLEVWVTDAKAERDEVTT